MNFKLDGYTIYARIFPVAIAVLPISLIVAAWMPSVKGILWGASASLCFLAIFAQIGRDAGKNKEKSLFQQWDGSPAVRNLRHQNSIFNSITIRRYHDILQKLVPGIGVMPLPEDEKRDLVKADLFYASCVDWLRANTRDREKFKLVYEENKNYGFRRNLWGLKQIAVSIAGLAFALLLVRFAYQLVTQQLIQILPAVILFIVGILLLLWIFCITPAWVRIPAEEYAKRLIEACDQLG